MYGRPIVICNKTFSVSYLTYFFTKRFDTRMSKTQLKSILLLSTSRKDNLTLYTLLLNRAIELVNIDDNHFLFNTDIRLFILIIIF